MEPASPTVQQIQTKLVCAKCGGSNISLCRCRCIPRKYTCNDCFNSTLNSSNNTVSKSNVKCI